jgi:hypothetical protein
MVDQSLTAFVTDRRVWHIIERAEINSEKPIGLLASMAK